MFGIMVKYTKNSMKVNFKLASRIHISLINMSSKGYRVNGGLGFFIDQPSNSLELEFSPKNNILEDTRELKISSSSFLNWFTTFLLENKIKQTFKVTISGRAPSHMGFGVSTSIRMACVEGVYKLLGIEISEEEIILKSRRGGTSGVGVHGYFHGGFVFDLGHEFPRKNHLPSRCYESKSNSPLLLNRFSMPNWEVGILIPKRITHKTHEEEKEFFEKTCPIDISSVYETAYHALFGILASAKTENFDLFCTAINSIQNQSWKKAERNLYPELAKFESILMKLGCQAVGMSSLGPSLYFFSTNIDLTIKELKNSAFNKEFEVLKTSMCNSGRRVRYEN